MESTFEVNYNRCGSEMEIFMKEECLSRLVPFEHLKNMLMVLQCAA